MLTLPDDVVRQQLQWRYATKKFDATRKILDQDWRTLEEALVYAPSSYGLQPWKFFVVTEAALRERLRPAAWNQPQITDASHLVVFAVRSNLGTADVDRHLARIAEVRGVSPGSLEGYKQMMLGSLNRPTDEINNWATRQVYIALGVFLSAAAMLGIDACPMEGFQPEKFDQILGLTQLGYASRVLATAGFRADDDPAAKLAKVRFPHEDVIHYCLTLGSKNPRLQATTYSTWVGGGVRQSRGQSRIALPETPSV